MNNPRIVALWVVALGALVFTPAGGTAPPHAILQIHFLSADEADILRTDSYAPADPVGGDLGDWAGRYWVKGSEEIVGEKDPLIVVGFETVGAGAVARGSHFVLLRFDPVKGLFTMRQVEQVGPQGTEIHFLEIFKEVAVGIRLDVYEGFDPTAALTVHEYLWDPITESFIEGASRNEPLPAAPEALPLPDPAELRVGPLPGQPFAVRTNSSVPGVSSVLLVSDPDPAAADLRVEANPKGGAYTATVPVALSSNSPTATILYTLDGSDPDSVSPSTFVHVPGRSVYVLPSCDPISGICQPTVVLSFKAIEAGKADSAIVREIYEVTQLKSADSDGDGLLDIWEAAHCVTRLRRTGRSRPLLRSPGGGRRCRLRPRRLERLRRAAPGKRSGLRRQRAGGRCGDAPGRDLGNRQPSRR
jgi:hypothetical protein